MLVRNGKVRFVIPWRLGDWGSLLSRSIRAWHGRGRGPPSLAFCVYEYVYLLSGSPVAHFIWLLVVEDAPSFGEGSLFQ